MNLARAVNYGLSLVLHCSSLYRCVYVCEDGATEQHDAFQGANFYHLPGTNGITCNRKHICMFLTSQVCNI